MSEANNNKAIQDAKKQIFYTRKIYKEMPVGSSFAAKQLFELGCDYIKQVPGVPPNYLRAIVAFRRAAKIGHYQASLLQGAVMLDAVFALDMSGAKRQAYFQEAEKLFLPYIEGEKCVFVNNANLYLGLYHFRCAGRAAQLAPSPDQAFLNEEMQRAADHLTKCDIDRVMELPCCHGKSDGLMALSKIFKKGFGQERDLCLAADHAVRWAKRSNRYEDYYTASELLLLRGFGETLAYDMAKEGIERAPDAKKEEGVKLAERAQQKIEGGNSFLRRVVGALTQG